MNTNTTAKVANVFLEEAEYGTKLLVSVVYSDGTVTVKRLSGAAARSHFRAMRAQIDPAAKAQADAEWAAGHAGVSA